MRAVHFHSSPPPVPCAPCDGICDYIVRTAQLSRCHAQEWTECPDLGAQSMHAGGGHDGLDVLSLNACIAWRGCQCKIWTGLSSTGPWPSATCTGDAGSSILGHVNTYHRTSPCALLWCSACMSKTLVRVATHELCCCWLLDRSEVCLRCAGDRLQRARLCVFQRASAMCIDLLHHPVPSSPSLHGHGTVLHRHCVGAALALGP